MFRIVKADGGEVRVRVTPCYASAEHLQRVAEENRLFAEVGARVTEAVDRQLSDIFPMAPMVAEGAVSRFRHRADDHLLSMFARPRAAEPWALASSDILGDMRRIAAMGGLANLMSRSDLHASKRVLSDPDFTLTEESDPGG